MVLLGAAAHSVLLGWQVNKQPLLLSVDRSCVVEVDDDTCGACPGSLCVSMPAAAALLNPLSL